MIGPSRMIASFDLINCVLARVNTVHADPNSQLASVGPKVYEATGNSMEIVCFVIRAISDKLWQKMQAGARK